MKANTISILKSSVFQTNISTEPQEQNMLFYRIEETKKEFLGPMPIFYPLTLELFLLSIR